MDKEPIAILVDIIKRYMDLDNTQIWQYNQEIDIENNNALYVVLHYMTSTPISSNSSFKIEDGIGYETIASMSKEFYRIEVASYDRSSIQRKEEILHALKAGYSQEMQARYGFRLFPLLNINNASVLKGGKMLNRFMIDVSSIVTKKTVRQADYYTNFPYQLYPNP